MFLHVSQRMKKNHWFNFRLVYSHPLVKMILYNVISYNVKIFLVSGRLLYCDFIVCFNIGCGHLCQIGSLISESPYPWEVTSFLDGSQLHALCKNAHCLGEPRRVVKNSFVSFFFHLFPVAIHMHIMLMLISLSSTTVVLYRISNYTTEYSLAT